MFPLCIWALGLILMCLGSAQNKTVIKKTTGTTGVGGTFGISHPGDTITYHNDPQRTGWNHTESILTPANVTPTTFGLLATVDLDDQVDTQPLVVADQVIEGEGAHTVVYVTTERNSVYAIDSLSGAILKKKNLGTPVPIPLGCRNNGLNVGINGTPTIDLPAHTMYVITYTMQNGKPSYQLHALDLSNLRDMPGSPVTVAASHPVQGGRPPYHFNPEVQRQRSALLLVNGNVYAAFASFCDYSPQESRGWLLGWNAGTLAPLATNELTNTLVEAHASPGKVVQTPPISLADTGSQWFLSSIWMSGYGVAADASGNLFFTTGNSEYRLDTYTGTTNIQESAVKVRGDLSRVLDLFTPSDFFELDKADWDFGSGGLMVLPDQPGPVPHIAVAAGKKGDLYVLNRDNMGGLSNPDRPHHVAVGECWCGPSYYQGSDGVGRVVSSGGLTVMTWKIHTALERQQPARPTLVADASGASLPAGPQDGGFFTAVSSNGTKPNTAIIWAVARPSGEDNHLTLAAFDGTAKGQVLRQLWSGPAGLWPNTGTPSHPLTITGNANIVPTVAHGRVYVAGYRDFPQYIVPGSSPRPRYRSFLFIFGLVEGAFEHSSPFPQLQLPTGDAFWGVVKSVTGSTVVISLRNEKTLQIDLSDALKAGRTIFPIVGMNVWATGTLHRNGILQCRSMTRAKGPASWGVDTAK
jgi:hypothetical protein